MKLSNLLLIAGTGNKSGKTTLACRVIDQLRDIGIIGIKITPHFHETTPGLVLLIEEKGYSIYEEKDPGTEKDTSRMLKAGAAKVFFAKVTDNVLPEAFNAIMELIPEGTPIVCESPALRSFIEPGLFIIMKSENANNNKNINALVKLPHVMFHLQELVGMKKVPVHFNGGEWIMNPITLSPEP